MRTILITGGAGFIGANFVLHLSKAAPEARLVVLDKLTYAGNLENLKTLAEGPNYRFVKGDINDAGLVDGWGEPGVRVAREPPGGAGVGPYHRVGTGQRGP